MITFRELDEALDRTYPATLKKDGKWEYRSTFKLDDGGKVDVDFGANDHIDDDEALAGPGQARSLRLSLFRNGTKREDGSRQGQTWESRTGFDPSYNKIVVPGSDVRGTLSFVVGSDQKVDLCKILTLNLARSDEVPF